MMQTYARAQAAYGQAAETLPPATRVVLLYDGALRRLEEARQAIGEGRVEDRFTAVSKASAIVEALHGCLDLARGGDLARRLDRLYAYLLLRMQQINVRDDASICNEVGQRLAELREAWAAIANGAAGLEPVVPERSLPV